MHSDPVLHPPFSSYDFHVHLGGCTSYRVVEQHVGKHEVQKLEHLASVSKRAHTLGGFLDYFETIERLQSKADFLYDTAAHAVRAFAEESGGSRCGLEMRWCPFLRRMPVADQISAIRAGLYSAGVKHNVETRLALIVQRGNMAHLSAAADYFGLVDTIDVAGPENGAETLNSSWLPLVREVYTEARSRGLQTTYHSGEGAVVHTLALLDSEIPLTRLGHGTALRLVDYQILIDHQHVTFELCPAVHACTGVAPIQAVIDFAHTLHNHGVPFVFGSDNPSITGVSYHQQAAAIPLQLREWAGHHATRLHHAHQPISQK